MKEKLNPCDREESIVRQYYQDIASDYDNSRFNNSYGSYIDRQERTILQRWLGNPRHQSVLDLACGTGRFLEFATVGLDASENMLNIARQNYPQKELILASASQIPIEPETFDAVFCFHLFMHLSPTKIQEILNECYRILRPQGIAIFDIPSALRRKFVSYQAQSWHGATSLSPEDIQKIADAGNWELKETIGIAFFPIHRLPSATRKFVISLDTFLCQSWMKSFASYSVFKLQKQ